MDMNDTTSVVGLCSLSINNGTCKGIDILKFSDESTIYATPTTEDFLLQDFCRLQVNKHMYVLSVFTAIHVTLLSSKSVRT
jgi:hypothetical protein